MTDDKTHVRVNGWCQICSGTGVSNIRHIDALSPDKMVEALAGMTAPSIIAPDGSHIRLNGWCDRCGGTGSLNINHVDTVTVDVLDRIANDTAWLQPKPAPRPDLTPIVDLVKVDLDARLAVGIKTYGTPLTAHNGRDALWDAYEEALDLCCYLRQTIEERRQ